MEFPTINPTMVRRLCPMGFGIDRRVGDHTGLGVFLGPNATTGSKTGAVDGRRTSSFDPHLNLNHQETTDTSDLGRKNFRDFRQTPFPGPPTRKTTVWQAQMSAKLLHFRSRLSQDCQQTRWRVNLAYNHDHQRFQEQPIRVGFSPSAFGDQGLRKSGYQIDQSYQNDEQGILWYHEVASVWFGVATSILRRSPRSSSLDRRGLDLCPGLELNNKYSRRALSQAAPVSWSDERSFVTLPVLCA